MSNSARIDRRTMLETSAAAAVGFVAAAFTPMSVAGGALATTSVAARVRFGVVGVNHSHIYGMVDAVVRGGGQLVSFHATEPDLAAEFAGRYPAGHQGSHERAILRG